MELAQLDAAIRISAVTTILLLASILWCHRLRVGVPATMFAPMAICLSGFVISNTPLLLLRPGGPIGVIAQLVSGYTVIFLWWFCLSCFDRGFHTKVGVLGVGLVWAAITALDRGLLGATFADIGLSSLLVVLGFGIVGHLVWRLVVERSGDLIQQRHDARIMVAVLLGGMLFIDLAADTLFGFSWRPLAFSMSQNAMILAFGLWLARKLLTPRTDTLSFGVVVRDAVIFEPHADLGDPGHDGLCSRLETLMNTQRIFLDADLSFATLADRMGAPERAVRRLVNHELGYDHFRTFLNHHRVAEACQLLGDPRRLDDKLIAIAFDSGFASLSSFNRVFRAIQGCSPSQYRSGAMKGSSQAGDSGISAPLPPFEKRKAAF